MTAALRLAMAQGTVAPETPEAEHPYIMEDCISGSEQHWVERARFRPIMKSRAGKPKNNKRQRLDRHAQIRRRRDEKFPAPSTENLIKTLVRDGITIKTRTV